jgi:hypothetical protein
VPRDDKSTNTRWLQWLAIIVPSLLAIIAWVISVEHRLTALETRIDSHEKRLTSLETGLQARFGQVVDFGGFQWQTGKGIDAAPDGKIRLGLQIDVLSDQFQWACGSPSVIVRDRREVSLASVMKGYSDQVGDSRAIIAVGMASMEGTDRAQQENLALERVRTLLNSISTNFGHRDLPLYGYWLGQYALGKPTVCSETADQTAIQRRVVLLKVLSWDNDLARDNAALEHSVTAILVQKAITESDAFPFDIRQYSRFRNRQRLLYGLLDLPR